LLVVHTGVGTSLLARQISYHWAMLPTLVLFVGVCLTPNSFCCLPCVTLRPWHF
jgi:hypothetical protein